MTLDEFEELLKTVRPGEGAAVPYAIYETLFPPGEPDDGARGTAYEFARARGFYIDNRPHENIVWFYKPAQTG